MCRRVNKLDLILKKQSIHISLSVVIFIFVLKRSSPQELCVKCSRQNMKRRDSLNRGSIRSSLKILVSAQGPLTIRQGAFRKAWKGFYCQKMMKMDTKENVCKKPAKMVVISSIFFFLIFKLAQQISSFQCWVSLNMVKKKKFSANQHKERSWGFRGSLPLFCRGWKVVDHLYTIMLLCYYCFYIRWYIYIELTFPMISNLKIYVQSAILFLVDFWNQRWR